MRCFSDLLPAALPPYGARMATCPECEFDEIETADYEEGDTFNCPECGKTLVSMGNDDVEIADEDEDLDDDDDDDDEEDDVEEEDEDDVDDDEEVLDEEEDLDE
jgi:hypothetical protein